MTGRSRGSRSATAGMSPTRAPIACPTSGCRRSLRGAGRSPARRRRPLRTAPRPASGRDELAALGADAVEQLREGVGELLHALLLERRHDVVVVNARLGDTLENAVRLVELPL